MSLPPGTRIGSYEITSLLGAGGMGEVYRARDTKLDRDVAIKILPDLFATDPDRLARFEREAKTLAALNHQNIAQVYDAGKSQAGYLFPGDDEKKIPGLAFLVMELVDGEDLSDTIARGAMTSTAALPIVRQMVDALEAAHDSGVVHRDLKPANIKVRNDGTVKVLDFGLAKISEGTEGVGGTERRNGVTGAGATMTSPAVTGMGVILGTASYMSPEQARGRPVDKRADIWAFGAVWFEMLTGRAPFPGETITDVIAAVVTREPDWTQLPAGTPPLVCRLIARCLEKDPRQRLRDIGEVRLALASPVEAAEPAAQPPGARSRFGPLGWIAAGVLLLALGASIFWPRPASQTSTPDLVAFDVVPPGKAALRLDSRPAVAVSPDGSHIVFVATESGVTKLFLRRRDNAEVRALPGTEGAFDPAFSPDGKTLAFVRTSELMRMTLDSAPVPVTRIGDSRGFTWVDDNQIVFSALTSAGLSIVAATGGAAKPFTTIDPKLDDRTHRWPATVPGGKAVLYTVGKISIQDHYDNARIDAVIVATGERRTVMEGASFVRVVPGGRLLYAKAGTVYAIPFDTERLVTTGQAVAVLKNVATDTTTGAVHAGFGPDGTVAYVPGGTSTDDREMFWIDRKGSPTLVALPPALYNDVRVSPDGSKIAVVRGTSGSGDVFVYDTHSTAFTRLTLDQENGSPTWSQDSTTLYYASIESSGTVTKVFKRPIDRSREAELLATVKARAYIEAIDESAKTAYLVQFEPTTNSDVDIVTLALDTGKTSRFADGPGNQYATALSPDGRWLAYQSDENGRFDVWVRDLKGAGGQVQVSTTGGEEPHWSATGDEIVYRNDTQFMSAKVTPGPTLKSNPPTMLFDGVYNLRSDTGITYDIDRRTGRFLMVRPAGATGSIEVPRVRVILNWLDELRRGGR